MLRYVLVLSVILSSNNAATALPAQSGLLEIRSMPAVYKKLEPVSRLLHRAVGVFSKSDWPIGVNAPLDPGRTGMKLVLAIGIPSIIAFPIAPEWGIAGTFLAFMTTLGTVSWHAISFANGTPDDKLKGQHIYYTKLGDDGEVVLCRGCVTGSHVKDMFRRVAVETAEGGEESVAVTDIGAVTLPDHPDLHRRVSLLATIDGGSNRTAEGKVSEVYSDGNYEIKFDPQETGQDIRVFVHTSVPLQNGGFEFVDD